ncbi:MAG: EamA family transporter [Leptolyngbya sp. RL_3_1]|nr:EamA family transporter [Leptolyngbya sp. RL_3_1]
MSPQEFGLLLIAVITSSCGQILLKTGALQLGEVTPGNAVSHILSIATTPALLGGLCAYGVGAIAYILALTRINLSIAAPSASLIYVFSVMAGYFFFQEPISIGRAVGMGLIICGVILVTVR